MGEFPSPSHGPLICVNVAMDSQTNTFFQWSHILIRRYNVNKEKINDNGASVSSVLSRPLPYSVYPPRPGKHPLAEYEESPPGGYSCQFYDAMTCNMRTFLVK